MADRLSATPAGYDDFLRDLKERIREAQVRAALAVNRELVLLYWRIGRDILRQQAAQGWGARVIDRLADDLRRAFPEMKGFSPRNLKYMRAFAQTYPDEVFVQQPAAQIPWFHNCVLLDKVSDETERVWYIQQTVRHGWSRNVLVHHARERELQRGLLRHLREFLLELGLGFAFVGSQHHLEVGGQDFYLDLLFYHLRLRCYVVLDLKVGEFQPEYTGKMNFYLSAVDDLLRHPDDQPSIGIILCKARNKVVVEYALRDTQKPIGVATYRLTAALPERLQDQLPTVQELEAELSAAPEGNGDA